MAQKRKNKTPSAGKARKAPAKTRGKGTLVIIGGHEDKEGDRPILKEVANLLRGGKLVVSTVASEEPEIYFKAYQHAFSDLKIGGLEHLYVRNRKEASDEDMLSVFENSKGIFFSGGDQLRISSQIGDTPFEMHVRRIYEEGGVIAGTSAGASAMGETMLIKGNNAESYKIGDLHLAPGLGLLPSVIIDQHFAERGRIGRLLGAIALNPRLLGIGIDEDTAIVVHDNVFTVIGSGAVYIVDGTDVTKSNIAEAKPDCVLSMFGTKLHVLSAGNRFDIRTRQAFSA